jgi:outer membrane biosynthesis protein TonB
VTELVEQYRRNAQKCVQLVQNFSDLEAKRALLVMASAWLMLAAQREKNIEAGPARELPLPVNEPPPPPHEPPRPIDEPKPPPVKEPPPATQSPPQRLQSAKPDDPVQR